MEREKSTSVAAAHLARRHRSCVQLLPRAAGAHHQSGTGSPRGIGRHRAAPVSLHYPADTSLSSYVCSL